MQDAAPDTCQLGLPLPAAAAAAAAAKRLAAVQGGVLVSAMECIVSADEAGAAAAMQDAAIISDEGAKKVADAAETGACSGEALRV